MPTPASPVKPAHSLDINSSSGSNVDRPQKKWALIWLAYTGFLFIDPLMEPSLKLWLLTLASFAAFLLIYAFYIRTEEGDRSRFYLIAATFALGLLSFPWNQGASTYFVYTAAFIPFSIVSVRRILWLFLLEVLIIAAQGYTCTVYIRHGFFHIGTANTLVAIFLTLVIGGGNILFAQQKRADCQLRLAQEENVALAAVAERERIARDLHDVLGHTLSVIVLKAELAGRLLNHPTAADPARAAREIADVERTARTALADVREAIGGYRAQGLAAEIESARRTLDAAGVALYVDSDAAGVALYVDSDAANVALYVDSDAANVTLRPDSDTAATATAGLSAAEETVLALALREAVTNIVRHARATTCRLRFITENGRRRLVIQDDGARPEGPHLALREGNGLRGMRERVESLGGRLSLERGSAGRSDLSTGTRLLIDLPLRSEAA